MTTAIGGASVGSPGGATDTTAPAANVETPADPQGTNESPASQSVSRDEFNKVVAAEKSLRKRVQQYEQAEEAANTAALSDNQKLSKQLATAQEEIARVRALYAETLVKFEAKELGYANADIGASLVLKDLEFDEDGRPTNAKALLEARLKTDSYLRAAPQSDEGKQPPPTVANLGATNGGSSGSGRAGLPTLDDFRKGRLTAKDAAAMWSDGSMQRLLDAEAARNRR